MNEVVDKYLGLSGGQLSAMHTVARSTVAAIVFAVFYKLSGIGFVLQKGRNQFDYIITALAMFILVSSIVTIHSFPAYIVSVLVLAMLMWLKKYILMRNK